MDLSKLPRMSETSKHAPPGQAPDQAEPQLGAATPQPAPVDYRSYDAARPGVGAEVWLSLIIGLILIMVGWRFARWAAATMTGQPFHTNVNWMAGPKAGQEVSYYELEGFTAWTETALFLFGVALVLEAAMLAVVYSRLGGKVALTAIALLVTVLATALNLVVAIKLLGIGIMPLMSVLAVGFGGYMAMYEWKLLQQLRATSAATEARA
jgi:hypothetical protein